MQVGVAQFSTTVVEREGAKELMRINRANENISMHLQDKKKIYLFIYFLNFFLTVWKQQSRNYFLFTSLSFRE